MIKELLWKNNQRSHMLIVHFEDPSIWNGCFSSTDLALHLHMRAIVLLGIDPKSPIITAPPPLYQPIYIETRSSRTVQRIDLTELAFVRLARQSCRTSSLGHCVGQIESAGADPG